MVSVELPCDPNETNSSSCTSLSQPQPQFYSVNIEFGYVCDDTKYIKLSISYQMIGIIVGSILFGQLSDSFGRKWVSMLIKSLDLLMYNSRRAVALFFTGGETAIFLVFLVENLPKKDRMWINMVISWSPNIAVFACLAYFCENWRTLAIAIGVITLLAIPLSLFIHESPRWLIQKGKTDEAHEVIKKLVTFNNGPKISDDVVSDVISKENAAAAISAGKTNFYVYHLFCTAQLTIYTLIFSFSYISTSIVNYGIFFNMAKLPGSVYANNIFIGLTRWIANSSVGFIDYKLKCFGRKPLHIISGGIIVIAVIIALSIIQLEKSEEYANVMRISVLTISIMTSHLYIGNNISSNELFPTPIRNAAFSFLQVVNRTGVAIAPQLFLLGAYWIAAPYLAMLLLVGTDLALYQIFIPESKGRPLKDSMPPVEERFFSKKFKTTSDENKYPKDEKKCAMESCV
ncbi:Solute carrier family 22 member 6 [Toxocara canis]|uniref:Solute carrier family 22 member 6 n=1 Tax=Toxocara canis TaxID=6265 RepID=A0A0B2VI95_TOXCA|nr:Solute carrier family 22 member 6 [Toxocara canis]